MEATLTWMYRALVTAALDLGRPSDCPRELNASPGLRIHFHQIPVFKTVVYGTGCAILGPEMPIPPQDRNFGLKKVLVLQKSHN